LGFTPFIEGTEIEYFVHIRDTWNGQNYILTTEDANHIEKYHSHSPQETALAIKETAEWQAWADQKKFPPGCHCLDKPKLSTCCIQCETQKKAK